MKVYDVLRTLPVVSNINGEGLFVIISFNPNLAPSWGLGAAHSPKTGGED